MQERTSTSERRNRLVVIALAVGWVVFSNGSADGCSCAGPAPVCQAYGEATAVFVGRVIEIIPPQAMPRPQDQQQDQQKEGDLHPARVNRRRHGAAIPREYLEMANRIRFAVEEIFTGEDKSEIEVQTHTQSSACGRAFTQGKRYLVYTHRTKQGDPLVTTICDRTQLAVHAEEDLAFLRSLPPKGTGGNLEITLSQLGPDSQPLVPVSGIRIVVATEAHSVEAITDAAGRSYLQALPAGTYRSHAVLPDSLVEAYPPQEIQVNDGGCSRQLLFVRQKE